MVMMMVMFIIIFNIMKIMLRLEEEPTELRSCQHLLRGMRSRKGATCNIQVYKKKLSHSSFEIRMTWQGHHQLSGKSDENKSF